MCLCLSKTANRIGHAVQKKLKISTNTNTITTTATITTTTNTTITTTAPNMRDTIIKEAKSKKRRHNKVTVN